MLATTLVATHSHSPWSSLPRERICRVPPGSVLCLLLLGFPTLGKEQGERGKKRKKKKTQLSSTPSRARRQRGYLSYLQGLQGTTTSRALGSPRGLPNFERGPGTATQETCGRGLVITTRTRAEKPRGTRTGTETFARTSLQHPKLKLPPLLGDGTPAVPREHPPRWVPAPRRCPNVPSRPQPAEERQNHSWQRFRQEGPQGCGKLTCTKVPGSSQAERKGWIL